ncbi:helix-turn-helix transcriptional regulator [Corallococcus exiguus]|nr:helix-turn-helix transcriptional regulator [Corallococcus exiguus]RKH86207.1 LuxR family transcriptional regulator [Corallococcus sp. AB032C]RKH97975.1 LuxR family transcriptional regulator [Corallococcus sp. AB030]NNB89761.1 helix-turn-helix transcriptional regulator [Corallococcus exiguus]NNB98383.1 helix-turn-helix transcriptional regulator [Corallococcus exiguus]NNC08159.1 helix-turn-helix transcriptional regulator [Corallococcus exiguus]
MRTPLPPGSHVLLVVPDPGAPVALQEQNRALAGELILNGQRYHLVPAEPSASPATAPASDVRLLTSRELQVVSCVCAGWGNKQIATKLNISTWTVAAHLRRIFVKLGVDTRAAMVSRCLGAVSLPPTS